MFAVAFSMLAACGGGGLQGTVSETPASSAPLRPVSVDEEALSGSVRRLLTDGEGSEERDNLLAGVVRHLLVRADRRFSSGHEEAGVRTLNGALYFMRAGEFRMEMLEGVTGAISAGARQAAQVGNEGRSLALYTMLRETLPAGPERKDAVEHLAALKAFVESTRKGALLRAGANQRASVERSLALATWEARETAKEDTIEWIREALRWNAQERVPRSRFDNEEAFEAVRAIRTGGELLSALYMRHVDPSGALIALDEGDLSRAISPSLREVIYHAADDDDPEAWQDLFRFFHAGQNDAPEGITVSNELSSAAAFGAAVGLYRSAPDSLFGVQPIAMMLLDFGMPEVVPELLASVVNENSEADQLSWALSVTLRAIISADELGELQTARRAFRAAGGLLELGRSSKFSSRINPNAAQIAYVMGAVETRNGQLDQALSHIEAAVKEDPSLVALRKLAAIERQQGQLDRAVRSLQAIVEAAGRQADAQAEGQALLLIFEIERDRGRSERAREVLRKALSKALDARQLLRSDQDEAEAERLLARVLEHYGEDEAAKRATRRAYDASASDQFQLAATVTDASRRALTLEDLQEGRNAVRQAIDAKLPAEDTVYAALWLTLLEQKLQVPSDGTAFEAFSSIDEASGWPEELRDWGLGRLDDQALTAAAEGPIEIAEATFYTAMKRRAAGDLNGALEGLRDVAKSPAVDLVEVTIARDLLAEHDQKLSVELPNGISLP